MNTSALLNVEDVRKAFPKQDGGELRETAARELAVIGTDQDIGKNRDCRTFFNDALDTGQGFEEGGTFNRKLHLLSHTSGG